MNPPTKLYKEEFLKKFAKKRRFLYTLVIQMLPPKNEEIQRLLLLLISKGYTPKSRLQMLLGEKMYGSTSFEQLELDRKNVFMIYFGEEWKERILFAEEKYREGVITLAVEYIITYERTRESGKDA